MEITARQKIFFTDQLINWHTTTNQRSLPWIKEKDPYKIWLSEIILQQTRAEQGLPYYLKFTEAYPAIKDMAMAADEEVYRHWQGLGYYNRCKNMLATARTIYEELQGKFPDSYETILQLKGIGPYTAAAIASFAYGLPHAVVDGNVYRVLARYFGIETSIDSTEGKKYFQALAGSLLYEADSAAYNQAIMDLGATVCVPANPLCTECPLSEKCTAYKQQLIKLLPVRTKKTAVKKRYFNYVILLWQRHIWIHQRTGKDIWQNLFEPLLIESMQNPLTKEEIMKHPLLQQFETGNVIPEYEGKLAQRLTHQLIESNFFTVTLNTQQKPPLHNGQWVSVNTLGSIAFPKTLVHFLEKKLLLLI